MSLSTEDRLQDAFRRALREDLQRNLRTPEDWDRFKAIQRETDARLMTEQARYARDYTKRLAEAKEVILREEHSVRLDKPLPPWAARQSDAEALQVKADTRVRRDHDQRCAVIKRDELTRVQELSSDIRARDAPQRAQTLTQTWSQGRSGPSSS